jgi:hypothetical protein
MNAGLLLVRVCSRHRWQFDIAGIRHVRSTSDRDAGARKSPAIFQREFTT